MAKGSEEEQVPEADRLGDLPHPRETTPLVGHIDAVERFARAFAGGRMPGAWLLSGPKGVGKATFAYHAARALLRGAAETPDQIVSASNDTVYQRVGAQGHGNLMVLRRPWDERTKRLKTELTVEQVRRTGTFFSQTASEAAWRICIVDSADEMNRNAANALLKTLEEPPARSVFLLVSRSPGRLPPTMRSRCRGLKFSPLAPNLTGQVVHQVLGEAGGSQPAELDAALALAEGSPGRALQLIEAGGGDLYASIVALMPGARGTDRAGIAMLADRMSRPGQDESYRLFRSLLAQAFSQIARTALAGSPPGDVPAALTERIRTISAVQPVDRWASLWEMSNAFLADVDAVNADRRQAIASVFQKIAPV